MGFDFVFFWGIIEAMENGYNHKEIEKKWQKNWQENGTYKASEDTNKPKKYILDMFPYPSGDGLHVGHPKGYIATDILSRYYRMNNFNVLHPMGWDAFGLPAELFAIKNKIHPKIAVDKNVATFKEQLSIIGLDYDWSRELNTTDPLYYKWTQWTFLQMFKKGLAFESHEPINWCPSCKTGLANEDLEDGKCERCGSEVEQKPLRQWVLRITDYAERMLADLDTLDKWPESVKTSQRNWIGKSEGVEIQFNLSTGGKVTVFTTRPDTLFGVTYVVLAPESHLVSTLKNSIQNWDEVKNYIEETKKKSSLDRQKGEKTGVELKGVKAINPANSEEVPVWIADYVLASYGTGAVMAVPAHDERDFEFAKKYNLPVKQVIARETGQKRENEEFKNGGAGVVFDPVSQKYAVADLGGGKSLLFAGGVDDGENVQDGVMREITEESGLHNFKYVEKIETSYAHYFNTLKKVNRVARAECFLVILENTDTLPVALEEHEKFTLVWKDAKEIKDWWVHHDDEDGFKHYIRFLDEAVARAIDLGYDTTSNPKDFKSTPITEYGILEYSGEFTGLTSEEAKSKITEFVGGEMKITYKLKDWVFSRQRYWGEPIPLIHAGGKVYPIPESDLPLKLPEVENYEPSDSGESPLADISEWVNVRGFVNSAGEFVVAENSPNGEEIIEGRRETNTMPQWAGSCWYYLRYIDPSNSEALGDKKLLDYWQPVDVYVGGMEHATRHLIYARFWHKFLFDIGIVSNEEPFTELHAPGLILAEDGRKMSKRWGNVVNPNDMVERFGADAFRLYEAFMGPFDDSIAWNTDGLVGTKRFVERVVRIGESLVSQESEVITRELQKITKKVTHDIPGFKFNTCVSAMMGFLNTVEKEGGISHDSFMQLLQLLAPFAPHITEEIWREELGNESSIHTSEWPKFDDSQLVDDEMTIVVQVNGKVRGKMIVPIGLSQSDIEAKAMEDADVKKFVTDTPKKIIYVPGKILNIVI